MITKSGDSGFLSRQPKHDLYNLLTQALLRGQASLPVTPRPELLALPDPYDLARNRPYQLHDASLYRGKYFLYFGVTPVLTLLLPVRALLGFDLSSGLASLLFALAGYAFSCAIFFTAARMLPRFPPPWLEGAAYLSLGLCTFLPYTLKRAVFYELAITSAYCFGMAGAYFLLRAWQVRRWPLFLLSGICFAFCPGARPNYAAGIFLILGWLATRRLSRPELTSFAAPIVLSGLLLAAYNYLRFGNLLEFGLSYQLTDNNGFNGVHPSVPKLATGLLYQLFSPPALSRSFPFVRATIPDFGLSALPAHITIEPLLGLIPALPLVLLAFPSFVPQPGRVAVISLLLIGLANLVAISALGMYSFRYGVDFGPSLMLVSLINTAALWSRFPQWLKPLIAATMAAAAGSGALLGLSGAYDSTLFSHPALFRRVSAELNRFTGGQTPFPSLGIDLAATVTFPARAGPPSPILTTGHYGGGSMVEVLRRASGTAEFRYRLSTGETRTGPAVSLLPEHEYFLQVRADTDRGTLEIRLDGNTVFSGPVRLYPSQLNEVRVARNGLWTPGVSRQFDGTFRLIHLQVTPSERWLATDR